MSATLADARAAFEGGRLEDAIRIAESLTRKRPADISVARFFAMLCSELQRPDTERAWQRVLDLAPGDPEAHYALGSAAGDRGDFGAAARHFRAALKRAPGHPQLIASLGLALEESGELVEAETHFREALARVREPSFPLVANLARNLFRQHRYDEALPHLELLSRRFGLPHAALSAAYAVCLAHARRDVEAEAAFRSAQAQDADAPGLVRDFAAFLLRRERHADAADLLDRANVASGDDLLAISMLLACRLHLCDWHDVESLRARVVAGVAAGLNGKDDIVPAYDFAGICDDPGLQRLAARRWGREDAPLVATAVDRPVGMGARVRLGFVSSDYGNHPVGRLVVALFESIDRARFEITAYATGSDRDAAFRPRIERAVDRHRILDRNDVSASVRIIAGDAIDVLFDLNGYSGGEAIRLFARRPAAVQINFLGYTGTLGSPAYDFIVADPYCIPPQLQAAYDEQVLRLDPCYLPSDPKRRTNPERVTRADYGLPGDAFVFCAFAAGYKILPEMFDRWMTLLGDVPRSVLWLRHLGEDRIARLRAEARQRGIDGDRLVVAPGEPIDRYLARFALADLFLDSAPFGSHTTVNDALFAGLPVVTIAGMSFAGRASASQLNALGATDLITQDGDAYVGIARSLAHDATRLSELRASLGNPLARSRLFDIEAYARAFEAAILAVLEARGLKANR